MRQFLVGFSCVAIALGCWLTAQSALCLDPDGGAPQGGARLTTRLAADLALIRGDLWTRTAREASSDDSDQRTVDAGSVVPYARRAVANSPLRSEAWLRLAQAGGEHGEQALTMAYFTGPGRTEDAGKRLGLAMRALHLDQPDGCDLVRSDVSALLGRGQDGAELIRQIYARGDTAAQTCLARAAGGVDASFSFAPNG